jgi:Spy/CpxP family protein refolding chaperone
MKKSILILCSFLMVFSIFAQGGGEGKPEKMTGAQMAERQTKMMTKSLKLTPDQVTKISQINSKYGDLIEKVRNDQTVKGREKMEKLKSVAQMQDKEFQTVLSAEQMTSYIARRDAKMEKVKEKRKEKRKGKRKGELAPEEDVPPVQEVIKN